eukprot:4772173-Heterocapsa_arctica.AAC.1
MVLFKEGDTEEEAIRGMYTYPTEAKQKLKDLGQVLNDNTTYLRSKQDRKHKLAPDQPRLQGESRTSGYLFRNHSQNTYASLSQQSQKS